MFYHVKSCQSCFMLSRPENIIRKIGVCLLVPTIKQANLHLQTMSGLSSTALGRPTTHQQRTTCECLWSQSGDLWIQARTIWQDHLWSHFVSPQYRNRFRWRPKKVYSMNYTYIYCNTIACHTAKSAILVLHIPSRWWKKLLEGSGEILHLRGGELCFWR